MNFFDWMFLSSLSQKHSPKRLSNDVSSLYTPNYSERCSYDMLRLKYMVETEATESLLDELFRKEPDFISSEIDPDVRERLYIQVIRYSFNGETFVNKTWFTISMNNRFIYKGILDEVTIDYIRECDLIDYSTRLFSPVANPYEHSISLGDFSFTFDHPFYYNLLLMLSLQADRQYRNGYRVSDLAITAPKILIDDDVLAKYNIIFDESKKENLRLTDACYCLLNDFNAEKDFPMDRAEGTIELQITDGLTYDFDNASPIALSEILSEPTLFANGSRWLSIGPRLTASDGTKYNGAQFIFLNDADGVTIKGDKNRLTIYVCRLKSGWGGIKFTVKDLVDYYRLAAWLVVAVSYVLNAIDGIDWRSSIQEYWPTYQPLIEARQIEQSSDLRFVFLRKLHAIVDEKTRKIKLDLARNMLIGLESEMHHMADLRSSNNFEFVMSTYSNYYLQSIEKGCWVYNDIFDSDDFILYEKTSELLRFILITIIEDTDLSTSEKVHLMGIFPVQAGILNIGSTDISVCESSTEYLISTYRQRASKLDIGAIYYKNYLDAIKYICDRIKAQLEEQHPNNNFGSKIIQWLNKQPVL